MKINKIQNTTFYVYSNKIPYTRKENKDDNLKYLSFMGKSPKTVTGQVKVLMDNGMNAETRHFIKLRDEFTKKLEPITIAMQDAEWHFLMNASDDNGKKYEDSIAEFNRLHSDKSTYKKFRRINPDKLPKHERAQLKQILKDFEENIGQGELTKAISDKETEINQKYSQFEPEIDGEKVDIATLSKILTESPNPIEREKAYKSAITQGDSIAQDMKELVIMRNSFAKQMGYNNYYEYALKEIYDIDPDSLDNLIDEVYAPLKAQISAIQEEEQRKLKDYFGVDKLCAWHYGIKLNDNPTKEIDDVIKKHKSEDVSKDIFKRMGYDIDEMAENGGLTLDLYPAKNKNNHCYCFDVNTGHDARILMNIIENNISNISNFCHELGHSVYSLNTPTDLSFFDRKYASLAFTEAIALMTGDLVRKENPLPDVIGEDKMDLIEDEAKKSDLKFLAKTLETVEFERDMYRNPNQDLAKLWQEKRAKYTGKEVEPDNEWATIPHYISYPAYYQNYFRATLMKAQIYNHLRSVLGPLTSNKNTAEYMNKNIFAYGATISDDEIIEKLTGKPLSSDDFIQSVAR